MTIQVQEGTPKSAVDSFEKIRNHAEAIKNDEHAEVGAMSVNDCYWQGDVGVVFVDDGKVPEGWQVAKEQNPQLAVGNTQGARHIIENMEGVTLFQQNSATSLDGPGIEAKKGFRLNHPEHGDRTFLPGVYRTRFQRAFGDELRAVQD